MSFLNNVRLVFSGTFQADTSTVNNDVRHFDNGTFLPRFQDYSEGGVENGWWNPNGSGAFRLLDCSVRAVCYGDGRVVTDPAVDPAVGMLIGGSTDRTSGKIVDIDPQWQLASELWGLDVRLTDRVVPSYFSGKYLRNAFRDLWFSRYPAKRNDAAASATFQSVLEEVTWAPDAAKSAFLKELLAATTQDRLSIRLTTFAYNGDHTTPRFTLGTVTGVIGPYLPDEPTSLICGRRFTPAAGFSSNQGLTFFSGKIDEPSSTLFLDFSNAFQIQGDQGQPVDVGDLWVGVLRDPATAENTPLNKDNFLALAEIPYRSDPNGTPDGTWLLTSGGVVAVRLTADQLALARSHPLAIAAKPSQGGIPGLEDGYGMVAIRESVDGLFVGAEPVVHRVDGTGTTTATVYAAQYGKRLPGSTVQLRQIGPMPDQGGGNPNAPAQPTAPIPVIGTPTTAITFPETVQTGAAGQVGLTIDTISPGNPRGYLDGQLYLVDYRLPGQGNQARAPFDYIVLHVRDDYTVPEAPTWEKDIQPIFTQYGNLYPIMSKRLIDLNDVVAVKAHADILKLSFTLPIENPNYMPVTRDLSEPKRQTIVTWLTRVQAGLDSGFEAALKKARHASLTPTPAAAATALRAPAAAAGPSDGKSSFARNLARSAGTPRVD